MYVCMYESMYVRTYVRGCVGLCMRRMRASVWTRVRVRDVITLFPGCYHRVRSVALNIAKSSESTLSCFL